LLHTNWRGSIFFYKKSSAKSPNQTHLHALPEDDGAQHYFPVHLGILLPRNMFSENTKKAMPTWLKACF